MNKLQQFNKDNIIQKAAIWFMLYAVAGWLYETVLEVMIYQTGFSNRGFLFGPYLPVYGVGALIFIFALQGIKDRKVKIRNIDITILVVFVGVVLISTAIELAGSYIAEIFTDKPLWNYDDYAFNFDGRIALDTSLRFGVGGTIFLYLLQPMFKKLSEKMSVKTLNITAATIFVILITDLILTLTI